MRRVRRGEEGEEGEEKEEEEKEVVEEKVVVVVVEEEGGIQISARTQGQNEKRVEKRLRHLEMHVEAEEAEGRETRLQTAFTCARAQAPRLVSA